MTAPFPECGAALMRFARTVLRSTSDCLNTNVWKPVERRPRLVAARRDKRHQIPPPRLPTAIAVPRDHQHRSTVENKKNSSRAHAGYLVAYIVQPRNAALLIPDSSPAVPRGARARVHPRPG